MVLTDDLSTYDNSTERFIYANPFLIMCTLNPNLVGYYINSINTTRSVEYSYINDETIMQFIGSNLTIKRNAINGENFYKISMQVRPTQELSAEDVVVVPSIADSDYYIRAEKDGMIQEVVYDETAGAIVANIIYTDGQTDQIQISSYVDQTPNEEEVEPNEDEDVIEDDEEKVTVNLDDGFYYHTGYTLRVNPHETFVEGDVLAVKKVTDLGRIRACIDINNTLYENGLYIPMVIEEYDEEESMYVMCGYISTDDIIDSSNNILIRNGIHTTSGGEDEDISLPYKNLVLSISIFFKNEEVNLPHKYSGFDYLHGHTLTNTYKEDSEDGIYLIRLLQYIRSTLLFSRSDADTEEGESEEYELPDESEEEDLDSSIVITIKEMPLVKANWLKNGNNFDYLISAISDNYDIMEDMYYQLKNNYGFDLKFYNSYGKSKFFRVGIKNEWQPLSRVNCAFRFGVYLSAITSQSTFLAKFRDYVKNAVESINSMNQAQQSIYILSMINDIQRKFSEIGYMEYYGFNDFTETTQKIEPIPTTEMSTELLLNYIPEFINISSHESNGEIIPDIDVEFLNVGESL